MADRCVTSAARLPRPRPTGDTSGACIGPGNWSQMHFAAAALVEPLYRGLADSSVGRIIEGLLRADLGIIDELGFAPLD